MPFVCHERHPTPFDIPVRWDPQRNLTVRALRVAFADFSAAPWQGLEKSERGPNNSSLHSLFCRYATSSPGRGKSLAAGRGRRRCCSSPGWPSERHPTPFDIPMRWDPRTKQQPTGLLFAPPMAVPCCSSPGGPEYRKKAPLGGAFFLWASQDLNPGPSGYEPPALTN